MQAVPTSRGVRAALSLALLAAGMLSLLLSALAVAPAHAQVSSTSTVLSGYVFDYKGNFVAGAKVTLYSMPSHTPAGPTAISDANGGWSFDTGKGTFAVRAELAGYDYSEQTVYATSYQTGIAFILRANGETLPLPLVARISGKVTSLDNVPLGGQTIVATNAQDTGVRQIAAPPTLNITTTDVNGAYSMQVPEGIVWLTIKTGNAWGYQRTPVQITASQVITNADFVVAIRVLPRVDFPSPTVPPLPTATATPISNVSPGIGMPSTGSPTGNAGLWMVLAGLGMLALLAGTFLAFGTRRPAYAALRPAARAPRDDSR